MRDASKKAAQGVASQPGAEWVSLNEATKILDVNREAVLQLGLAGALEVQRYGRWTFVLRASIDAYVAAPVIAR